MKFQQVYPTPSQIGVIYTYTIITHIFYDEISVSRRFTDQIPGPRRHPLIICASFLRLWAGYRLRGRILRQRHCTRWLAHPVLWR